MDVKHCPSCHKLMRASAQTCSRCGRDLTQKNTPITRKVAKKPLDKNGQSRDTMQSADSLPSHVSIPPASPHRAGHYSGLHPEDQPYQSGKIFSERPRADDETIQWSPSTRQTAEPEVLPQVDLLPEPPVYRQAGVPQRRSRQQEREELQVQPMPESLPVTPRPVALPRRRLPRRTIPIMLTLSCIFFLLASTILVYVLIASRSSRVAAAGLTVSPSSVRINDLFSLSGHGFGPRNLMLFTHDINTPILDGNGHALEAHADNLGNFSVQMRVPSDWGTGLHLLHVTDEAEKLSVSTSISIQASPTALPALQLSTKNLQFDADTPGTLSTQSITLKNTGGGEVKWQSSSDQPWLTTNPNSGTFAGSQTVRVIVNRANLAAKAYTGQITFTQAGGEPIIVKVSMDVKTAQGNQPALLNISTPTLSYSATSAQNPANQKLVIQNSGGQTLHWKSTITTGDGSPWLKIDPAEGHLDPDTSAIITVSVESADLAVGSYQAAINFIGEAKAQVAVSLNVIAPGNLVVSPPSLTFSAATGQIAKAQTVTLQNSGGLAIDWSASTTTNDQNTWLSVTPVSGSLNPQAQVNVEVNADATKLKPASYQGMLTLSYGDQKKQVAVSFTVTPPPTPVITVQPASLNFTTFKGKDPVSQSVSLSNTGDAPLNWTSTNQDNTPSSVGITPDHGSLNVGKSIALTIAPKVSGESSGVRTTIIWITDTNADSSVSRQKIVVTVTIKDQPGMTLSTNSLTLNHANNVSDSGTFFSIKNDGTRDLHWAIAQPPDPSAKWLTVNVNQGTVAPGKEALVSVDCNSKDLQPGRSYEATFLIKDTDPSTPLAPQVVNIKLVVE